jgi:hypothetical protein
MHCTNVLCQIKVGPNSKPLVIPGSDVWFGINLGAMTSGAFNMRVCVYVSLVFAHLQAQNTCALANSQRARSFRRYIRPIMITTRPPTVCVCVSGRHLLRSNKQIGRNGTQRAQNMNDCARGRIGHNCCPSVAACARPTGPENFLLLYGARDVRRQV